MLQLIILDEQNFQMLEIGKEWRWTLWIFIFRESKVIIGRN